MLTHRYRTGFTMPGCALHKRSYRLKPTVERSGCPIQQRCERCGFFEYYPEAVGYVRPLCRGASGLRLKPREVADFLLGIPRVADRGICV